MSKFSMIFVSVALVYLVGFQFSEATVDVGDAKSKLIALFQAFVSVAGSNSKSYLNTFVNTQCNDLSTLESLATTAFNSFEPTFASNSYYKDYHDQENDHTTLLNACNAYISHFSGESSYPISGLVTTLQSNL